MALAISTARSMAGRVMIWAPWLPCVPAVVMVYLLLSVNVGGPWTEAAVAFDRIERIVDIVRLKILDEGIAAIFGIYTKGIS
jgi:hypothetical protein